jgi:hypothetical protein
VPSKSTTSMKPQMRVLLYDIVTRVRVFTGRNILLYVCKKLGKGADIGAQVASFMRHRLSRSMHCSLPCAHQLQGAREGHEKSRRSKLTCKICNSVVLSGMRESLHMSNEQYQVSSGKQESRKVSHAIITGLAFYTDFTAVFVKFKFLVH